MDEPTDMRGQDECGHLASTEPVRPCAWQLMRSNGTVMLTTSDLHVAQKWRQQGNPVRACVPAPEDAVW